MSMSAAPQRAWAKRQQNHAETLPRKRKETGVGYGAPNVLCSFAVPHLLWVNQQSMEYPVASTSWSGLVQAAL